MSQENNKEPYGSVSYADPGYQADGKKRYPIDTKSHVRAAWSYINMPRNASKYDSSKLSTIKSHIKTAAKKYGISISGDGEKTKAMSAKTYSSNSNGQLRPVPNAFRTQPQEYKNIMNTEIFKAMAAELGMEDESDTTKVLFAFLAKYIGVVPEDGRAIVRKDNTEDGGLKQFSAEIESLKNELNTLKEVKQKEAESNNTVQRKSLVALAVEKGKVIPLSADELKTIDLKVLESIIEKTPSTVPMRSQLKALEANMTAPTDTKSKEKAFLDWANVGKL